MLEYWTAHRCSLSSEGVSNPELGGVGSSNLQCSSDNRLAPISERENSGTCTSQGALSWSSTLEKYGRFAVAFHDPSPHMLTSVSGWIQEIKRV